MLATKETVRRCLLLATTMTKGVALRDVTGDMVDAWHASAQRHRMTDQDFLDAFRSVVDRSTFFPAWAEVLAAYSAIAHEKILSIDDPIYFPVPEGQAVMIGSESQTRKTLAILESLQHPTDEELARADVLRAALRNHEEAQRIASDPTPALPGDRQQAMRRYEAAIEKLETKTLERPARVRSAKVEGDDPEAAEKRRAMVEDLRKSEAAE